MIEKFHSLFLGTLRRQLIWGIVLTVASMMALFVWTVTQRQHDLGIERDKQEVLALTNSLATSSAIWVASRDVSGLQEIVNGLLLYPNLNYAIVLDLQGQVMAHTDATKIGLYIREIANEEDAQTLRLTSNMLDVTKAVMLADEQVGWVRISLDRKPFLAEIAKIQRNGLFFALFAILFSTLITMLASQYLTRRLNIIQKVADQVYAGDNHFRVGMSGNDEAAQLASRFDSMLDSLENREAQLSSFYSLGLVGLSIISPKKVWISANDCLCEMLEYSEQELQTMTWSQLTHPDDIDADADEFNKLLANELDGYSIEKRFISRTGKVIPTKLVVRCVRKADGSIDYVTAMIEDISKSKADALKIEQLAYFDPLTQLPNRRLLHDRLNHAMEFSTRSGSYGAVLFLDLDHFKTLNDTLGHDRGDKLLQQVAERLTGCLREGDTVARFGGDEFVVLLEGLSQDIIHAAKDAELTAHKILNALNQPYSLEAHSYSGSTSIGVAQFLDHNSSIDEVLKQADIALYQAKHDGRNTVRFFDPQMQVTINERAEMEHDLRDALLHQHFRLYFQIQVDESGKPLGAEALIRWIHPKRGMITPFSFIPVAEDSGIIIEIGQWVLETACKQLSLWQQNSQTAELSLSVNVSAKQFQQADFVEQVIQTIQTYGINPTHLKLELTESLLLKNIDDIVAKMNALAGLGIQFSLDDFGTGYSSLQYLKQLPLSQLKIDQSFVRDLEIDRNDEIIVKTIISMAHTLGLSVIAEGVENEQQRQHLLTQGCTHFQGYLFSKPVPLAEFEHLIAEISPSVNSQNG